jgi:hypothetical protein
LNFPNCPTEPSLAHSNLAGISLLQTLHFSISCYRVPIFTNSLKKVIAAADWAQYRIPIITINWVNFPIYQQKLLLHTQILQASARRELYNLVSPVIVFQFLRIL